MVEDDLTGYLSGTYAGALSHIGKPMRFPRSKGWVLRRPIPDTDHYDATGLYPLMCCRDWGKLESDMPCLFDLVSLVFVADPFANLGDTFYLDLYSPYKLHYIVDYSKGFVPTKHHRYYAKKALCHAELVVDPDLDVWCELYDNLIERHQITGTQAFSRDSFEQQLQVPGLIAFQAYDRTGVLGMHLWYVQGDVAYSHLAACSDKGYDVFAAYKMMDMAISFFAGNVRYLDIGGVADNGSRGLEFFKKGWSNGFKQAYLCGKILDLDRYWELVGGERHGYFPAYRG